MASFKQMTIVGNLGGDPVTRFTTSGDAVASFNVAVKGYAKKGQDAPTLWIKVSAWRKLAEVAGEYLKKGSLVLVIGDPDLETYEGRDGSTRSAITLTADKLQILTPRGALEAAAAPAMSGGSDWPDDESSLPF